MLTLAGFRRSAGAARTEADRRSPPQMERGARRSGRAGGFRGLGELRARPLLPTSVSTREPPHGKPRCLTSSTACPTASDWESRPRVSAPAPTPSSAGRHAPGSRALQRCSIGRTVEPGSQSKAENPTAGFAEVDFGRVGPGWAPLVGFGHAGRQDVIAARRESGGLRFGLGEPDGTGLLRWSVAPTLRTLAHGHRNLFVLADRANHALSVQVDGHYLLSFSKDPPGGGAKRIADGPVSLGSTTTGGLAPFPGEIRRRSSELHTCERLRRLATKT